MKEIQSLDNPLFNTLEKEKMKKANQGQENPCSQPHTVTVTPRGGADDGCDSLQPHEHQDDPC